MSKLDLSFTIKELRAFHLAFPENSSYWEQYRLRSNTDEDHRTGGRYEFKPGWQTVYATAVETSMAKVALVDRYEGWGESNTPIAPEVVCLILEAAVAEMVVGREFDHPAELWNFVYDSQRGRGINSGYWMDALAALDIAIWDALGKRHDLPVAAMLSSAPRIEIPVYLSGLRQSTLSARVERARRAASDGVRGVKIFQNGNVEEMLRELDGLIRGEPGIEQWMVDTLWMCDLETARRAKRELGSIDVRFFECPLQPEDLAGHRSLIEAPGAAIALGEHFRTRFQLGEWLHPKPAFNIYQPDIGRTGISDFVRQRDLAYATGTPVTPHMGNGASVFQAATLQCAAVSSSSLLQEFQGGLSTLLSDASDSAWTMHDGIFALPDRPGIGVEIDLQALSAHIARPSTRR